MVVHTEYGLLTQTTSPQPVHGLSVDYAGDTFLHVLSRT